MQDYFSEHSDWSPSEDEMEALRQHEQGELKSALKKNDKEDINSNIDLRTAFRKLAPPTKRATFQPSEQSKLKGLFSDAKKESNLKMQRRMMANQYGSAQDLPTSADMNLESLALASRLDLRSYDIAQLHRSARIASQQTAKVVRPAVALGQMDKHGKLKRLDESIEDLMTGEVDLSGVDSIFETSYFKKAKEWLVSLQKTPEWPPSTDPRFVGWLIQMCAEHFGTAHVYGKVATGFTVLLEEIEDEKLKKQFKNLVDVLVKGNAIVQQHQPQLCSLKAAVAHKADPKAFATFREKLKKRSDSYKIKTKDNKDALSHYDDLIVDPEEVEKRLTQNRKTYNWKRKERRERKSQRKTRDRDRDYYSRDRFSDGKSYQKNKNRDITTQEQKRNNRTRKPFIRPEDATCFHCKQKGHKKSHCPTMICQVCGQLGHSASVCPKRRKN